MGWRGASLGRRCGRSTGARGTVRCGDGSARLRSPGLLLIHRGTTGEQEETEGLLLVHSYNGCGSGALGSPPVGGSVWLWT